MRAAIIGAAVALITSLAAVAEAATIEWVTGTATLNNQPVRAGMSVPDNASLNVANGSRVKVNFSNGSSTIIQGRGAAVSLSSYSGGGSSLAVATQLRQTSTSVSAVAGVRASDQVNIVSPLQALNDAESVTQAEKDAVSAAMEKMNSGDSEGAISALRAFVSENPQAYVASFNLGMWLADSGDNSGAIELLNRVIETPRDAVNMPLAYLACATAQFSTGQHAESSRVAQRALDSYPSDFFAPRFHILIARNAAVQGNAVVARAEANRAMEIAMQRTRRMFTDLQGEDNTRPMQDILYANDAVVTIDDDPKSRAGAANLLDEHEMILDARRQVLSSLSQ
jgi:tetratricopeptide (TPR) repeat protein